MKRGIEPVHSCERTYTHGAWYKYDRERRAAWIVWTPDMGGLPPPDAIPINLFNHLSLETWAESRQWRLGLLELHAWWVFLAILYRLEGWRT